MWSAEAATSGTSFSVILSDCRIADEDRTPLHRAESQISLQGKGQPERLGKHQSI